MRTITVNRKSWHYRLHVLALTFFNVDYGPLAYKRGQRWEHKPKTLCGYFWSTAVLTLLSPLLLAFMGLVVAPVYGLLLGLEKAHGKYREARPRDPDKPYKVDTLIDLASAGKKRACPLVTVSD